MNSILCLCKLKHERKVGRRYLLACVVLSSVNAVNGLVVFIKQQSLTCVCGGIDVIITFGKCLILCIHRLRACSHCENKQHGKYSCHPKYNLFHCK